MNKSVLIAAYESANTKDLLQGLKGMGIPAHLLSTARSTMAFLQDRCPAVVVLDKTLPDISGLNLCRLIKTEGSTVSAFVLVLLDEIGDQLDALELGAADCVMKPFNARKLALQIRNLLRSISDTVKSDELKVGDLSLDRARHEVRAANSIIECTPKEFILLGLLMERSGRVQTREQLLNEVWEMDLEVGPRAVDRHVCCLRAKLGPLGRYIQTIPSAGYRLLAQDRIAA
jgi:two-component system, OmpR family, phosphate regulon response regulator PhoB